MGIKRLVIEDYRMQDRMQKTLADFRDCPQKNRTESEGYEGVQTYRWMIEDNIAEVPFDWECLYGKPSDRLYLHAARMEFLHPITNETLTFESVPEW